MLIRGKNESAAYKNTSKKNILLQNPFFSKKN